MSKAFTKETDTDDEPERPQIPVGNIINYVTPYGFAKLQNELNILLRDERPKVVDTVRWAAGNGDRSENGDYIYGKRRLREIDRRVRYLRKRLADAKIIDPRQQQGLIKVFFGATVTYIQKDGINRTVKIVGIDEADLKLGKISWISPVAKALMKAEVGDCIEFTTPAGIETLEILAIEYEIEEE